MISNQTTWAQFPQAEISNGLITVKLYLPDAEKGYYRGSRFDWSGVIPELKYQGHDYFGQWFSNYDPIIHDAICGPTEEFSEINYDQAPAGGEFIRIGIGGLRKPVEDRFNRFGYYQLSNPGKWTVKKGKDNVVFTHQLKDVAGYSYVYEKKVRLLKGKPQMVLEHKLKNTGKKAIQTDVYCHNFFTIDHQPTGPNSVVKFAFPLRVEGESPVARINGRQIEYIRDLSPRETVFWGDVKGHNKSVEDYDFRIENLKTGAGVRITGDRPISKIVYWSSAKTQCPEPYIDINVQPGETFSWTITYDFYTFDALSSVETNYPMFWTWYNYRPNPDRPIDLDSVFKAMQETGLDGVVLNARSPEEYSEAIPVAAKYGLETYAWWWGLNLEHDRDSILKAHPEWFSVNRLGQSLADTKAYVDYYKFLCPALPEVREYLKGKIKKLCEVDGLNGIAIDYTRFVDVILPTTLWPRYGIVQDKEYAEWDYGYHPVLIEKFVEKHGYDPRELDDPSTDDKWLQFRCDQVTELVNELADVVHSYGKKMSASPFPTPAMSRRMVRQDWGKWNLDIVFPMVYYGFYTGDVSFISDCTIENVKTKNPNTTLFCGMTAVNSPAMFECMDAALNNGAEGICLFTVGSLRDPQIRSQFKVYADSVREARAESKINPNATGITTVDTNPFNKPVIMDFINNKIAAYAGVDKAAVKLSEYNLDREFGTTKYYKVTEQNTGIVFNVDFYLYGDLVSGWNVEPEKK